MSHYGSPPDQPEEGAAAGTPAPDPSTGGAAPEPPTEAGVTPGAEKPWSPYPDNWDDLGAKASTPQPQAAPNPYAASSPYGEPAPYGVPQSGATAANPYGGTPVAAPAFAFGGYASWGSRVVAYLIDAFLGAVAAFPIWIAYGLLFADATTTTDVNGVEHVHLHSTAATTLLFLIGIVTSLAFFIWNQCIRQGRTGATLGKSVLAIRVVHADMLPIGGGLSFVRYLLNIVNGLPCYLGYLWPLWDSHRQTFADKIMSTYVIKAETPQPRVY